MDNEAFLFGVLGYVSRLQQASLTANQLTFDTIWMLEAEVNNGGFSQYFHNSSGAMAREAPDALRAIGANQCAELVVRAIEVVSPGELNWKNEEERREFFTHLPDDVLGRLDILNKEFFSYPDNLSDLLAAFVRSNIADFRTSDS